MARVFKCDATLRQKCSNIVQAAATEEATEQGQHIDRGNGRDSATRHNEDRNLLKTRIGLINLLNVNVTVEQKGA
jgi:hypothetical protein